MCGCWNCCCRLRDEEELDRRLSLAIATAKIRNAWSLTTVWSCGAFCRRRRRRCRRRRRRRCQKRGEDQEDEEEKQGSEKELGGQQEQEQERAQEEREQEQEGEEEEEQEQEQDREEEEKEEEEEQQQLQQQQQQGKQGEREEQLWRQGEQDDRRGVEEEVAQGPKQDRERQRKQSGDREVVTLDVSGISRPLDPNDRMERGRSTVPHAHDSTPPGTPPLPQLQALARQAERGSANEGARGEALLLRGLSNVQRHNQQHVADEGDSRR
eukprot:COSAG05_NODE_3839_length_1811_cov_2.064252_1_plen_268_part_00